jgi:hypothetical protein
VKPEKKSFVVFVSPGTFVDEESERPVTAWDPREALALSEQIRERYGARPYGFYFVERLVAAPVPDGQGGTMEVRPKTLRTSGTYYIDGRLRTYDEVVAEDRGSILATNMRCNDWPIVVETTRSFRHTGVFKPEDFVVAADGSIRERGDDPRHVSYRERIIAEHKAELAAFMAQHEAGRS